MNSELEDRVKQLELLIGDFRSQQQAVAQAQPPIGSIISYGGVAVPVGWLFCHGQSLAQADFSAVHNVIGNAFGGDAVSFNLPDLRGRFIRGIDHEANRDPDHMERGAMNTGGNRNNSIGSIQGHAFERHNHDFAMDIMNVDRDNTPAYRPVGSDTPGPRTTGNRGGKETRPINAYVEFIIRVY